MQTSATEATVSVLEACQEFALLDDQAEALQGRFDAAVAVAAGAAEILKGRQQWQREFWERARRGYTTDPDPTPAVQAAMAEVVAAEDAKRSLGNDLGKLRKAAAEARIGVAQVLTRRGVPAVVYGDRLFINRSQVPAAPSALAGRPAIDPTSPSRMGYVPGYANPIPAPYTFAVEVIPIVLASALG